jgi:predicted DNA-binding transcriptional regulator YafY
LAARLLEASVAQRIVSMRYHSQESGREKEYVVHPYRLVQAQGGLYLIAFVPAYSELRTFAVERIRRATVQDQTFELISELDADPFKNSLGVHRGATSLRAMAFDVHPRRRARSVGGLLSRRRPLRDCGDLVEAAFTACVSRSTRSARNIFSSDW